MKRFPLFRSTAVRRLVQGLSRPALLALLCLGSSAFAAAQPHFDVNDISFLFPVPKDTAGLEKLIALDELTSDGAPLLTPDVLSQMVEQALKVTLNQSSGAPAQITFADKAAFLKTHNWKVVGIRVDPCAPGTHPKAIAFFGEMPQMRLIVQPVTADGSGGVTVHDVAMHLVFDFISGFEAPTSAGAPQRALPDRTGFRQVLDTLQKIKSLSAAAQVATEGNLDVHPAFQKQVPGFAEAVRGMVKTHLNRKRMAAIAFMGVQDEAEPWIFFAMVMQNGALVPLSHPSLSGSFGEMLTFRGGAPVVPTPVNNNFPGGVSTRLLFDPVKSQNLDQLLFPGSTIVEVKSIRLRDIPDIIANPQISNFPNTDCVSCHSESARRSDLSADSGNDGFRYQRPAGTSGINPARLPNDQWNVRNFGWSPFANPPETVTMRTANEAAASADFINRVYFGQALEAPATAGAKGGSAVALGTAPSDAVTPVIAPETPGQSTLKTPVAAAPGTAPAAPVAAPEAPKAPAPAAAPAPVANALTVVMKIKSKEDLAQLKGFLAGAQVPGRNMIQQAMNKLGIVHFARFILLDDEHLAIITNFDGSFDRYIGAFTTEIGPIFDALLAHMADAPPLPVKDHPKEFLEYVRKNDLSQGQPGYSAYPDLKVQDILTLQKEARSN